MSGKGKSKKASVGAKSGAGDDDWDNILDAEISKNAPVVVTTPPPPPLTSENLKAKDDDDDDDDEDDEKDAAGGAAKKDKKKKKKKDKKKADDSSETAKPISAQAQAILLRKQKIDEEEARIKALRDEQERIIKEEEEREAEIEKKIQEDKDRKKKAKQDKVAAEKEAGTYMTKAEKEKAKLKEARIQAMQDAGMLAVPGVAGADSSEKTKVVYSSKKKPNNSSISNNTTARSKETEELLNEKESLPPSVSKVEMEPVAATISAPAPAAASEDSDDDWESSIEKITSKVASIAVVPQSKGKGHHAAKYVAPTPLPSAPVQEEEEDLLEQDKRREQDRLRQLGLERMRRDEEARLKREEEERVRSEIDRQAREAAMKKENSRKRRMEKEAAAREARTPDNLRAAISVIMGHVDTGKTKLLDKIRNTNVQEGEAGGITQQIGATHFPKETLHLQTKCMQASQPFDIKLPGLLVIDTPGHESFSNLRNRGSSLCDIAILVIDLMHGLEPQTVESINLLRKKKAPFVVALNKVDRLYGWKKLPDGPIREALALQDENCRMEFKSRTDRITVQLNELGLNAKLYWENDSLEDTISLCPTSAMSGEGVPDLIMNLINFCQNRLVEKLMYMEYLQCTVLEVKVIEGLGPSIDVVLLNGTLREGDRIVLSTLDGPVITQVRALLTPPPNREMRVKSEYIHHSSLKGAMGVKIVATDLQRAVAGTPLMVINPEDDEEDVTEDVQSDLKKVTRLETDSRGVTVHASTLGALEALLQFLREECKPPIPVSAVSIGTIFKKDVMRANIMNEKNMPEYATILAFDVRIDSDAQEFAELSKVRIFTADIIYHLFDQFSAFMKDLLETRRTEAQARAVFPCVLKIFPQHVFNKKDPIVLGVEVVEGTLKIHTPLCIPQIGLDVGRVISIENNHKEVNQAKKGTNVAIKITCEENPNMMYGRQFDHNSSLYSKISRTSIDALKEFFKDDVSKEDWLLIQKLKKVFQISDKKKSAEDKKKSDSSAAVEEDF